MALTIFHLDIFHLDIFHLDVMTTIVCACRCMSKLNEMKRQPKMAVTMPFGTDMAPSQHIDMGRYFLSWMRPSEQKRRLLGQ